jgi:hypothetical protein
MGKNPSSKPSVSANKAHQLPGQVVLVFQGGGALGAYQGGIYEALHKAGIELNWLIGNLDWRHQCGNHRRQCPGQARLDGSRQR